MSSLTDWEDEDGGMPPPTGCGAIVDCGSGGRIEAIMDFGSNDQVDGQEQEADAPRLSDTTML